MAKGASRVGAALAAALTAALAVLVGSGGAWAQPPAGSLPKSGGDQPVDPYATPAPAPARPPAARPVPAPDSGSGPANEGSANQPGSAGESGPTGEPGQGSTLGGEDDIDDQVAQALYRRGVQLYQRGAAADAKTLFIESLERSPRGRASGEALRMLRAANRRLRIANQDDGRPYGAGGGAKAAGDEGPLDPYGAARGGEPGGAGKQAEEARAPVDEPGADQGSQLGRRMVIGWSGAVGLLAGLALAGPENDSGDLSDGAVVAGLVGAAGGVGLSYWLTRRTPLTDGQSAAITAGATWGAASAALLGDATTGTDSVANDIWKYAAAGGLIGLGGGVLYARLAEPSESDIALTNSLSAYGALLGVFIGAGIDPPESEAFSLNALFGSTAGIAAGVLLRGRVQVSRRRTLFLDLGALAGAAASWGLLYPLISDDTTHNDEQVAGWVSTATLGGGVALAYYFTRGMDAPHESLAAAPRRPARAGGPPPPPALAQREAGGEWRVGVPFLRPLRNPVLAPAGGETAIGIDLLSGRF